MIQKDFTDKLMKNDTFPEFMQKLMTDETSLLRSDNAIRKVYEGFKSGTPQRWHLFEPEEYMRCIQQYSPQSGAYDDCWAPRIAEWVANAKKNVLQFAANSYLCSGPTLEQDSENSQGQNLHALLWYHLTGDEEIPYRPGQCGNDSLAERAFFDNYWRPFTKYIETKYGDGAETFETDSPLDGFFDIIADFDKNYPDYPKMLATLDKLIHLCHHRGTLAHLFVKGGNITSKLRYLFRNLCKS
jgi:hypothetical protein